MATTYGIEIESFGLTREELRTTLTGIKGQDRDSQIMYDGHHSYHHYSRYVRTTREHANGHQDTWISESDSSITNNIGRGISHEVISPIMVGQPGLATVRRVMKAMYKAGARTNGSTGTHLTVGVRNSSARVRRMSAGNLAQRIGRLVDAYDWFYEGAFCRLVSPTRRNGAPEIRALMRQGIISNDYGGQRIRYDGYIPNTFGTGTKDHYQRMIQNGVGRGCVNLGGFVEHGVIEFRQHNGTLNGHDISNWAGLMQKLISWTVNDEHINNGCDIRSFPPTLNGLMDMLNIGSDLRTALLAREAKVGTRGHQMNNMTNWAIHDAFLQGNISAGMNETVVYEATINGGDF